MKKRLHPMLLQSYDLGLCAHPDCPNPIGKGMFYYCTLECRIDSVKKYGPEGGLFEPEPRTR